MLESLYIKNIALIKELNIEFKSGFTVFTGETGAGKSIIIDSIGLLLGKHTSRELIRTGEESAHVSGVITTDDGEKLSAFEEAGISPDDGAFLFSKDISRSSRNSSRINSRPVSASISRELIGSLMTIHGQNDNQSLFDPKNHIKILDSFAKNDGIMQVYRELYIKIRELDMKISALKRNDAENLRRSDMLRFQAEEIKSARVKIGEEKALLEKKKLLLASEKIMKSARIVYRALYSNEKGVSACDLISKAETSAENLSEFFPELSDCGEKLEGILSELRDIAERVRDVMPEEEENPTEALDKIEDRLNTLEKLYRKYGAGEKEVLEYYKEITDEISEMDNSEELIGNLGKERDKLINEAKSIADDLSETRKKAAIVISEKVSEVLKFLDMPSVRFSVDIKQSDELLQSGTDIVEFLISPNPGEPLLPMAKIASGGELARIMLALKSVLSESDRIPTVIFDEIDTGISGKTSRKVGIKLKELSKFAQVICVTHSAQIASLADTHIKISKKSTENRTETSICELTYEERIDEVARILGGIEITKSQRETARELIAEGATL